MVATIIAYALTGIFGFGGVVFFLSIIHDMLTGQKADDADFTYLIFFLALAWGCAHIGGI
jgi:hypothetical protein